MRPPRRDAEGLGPTRLFGTDSDAHHLRLVTLKQTPDLSLDKSLVLANYVSLNAAAIINGALTVPAAAKACPSPACPLPQLSAPASVSGGFPGQTGEGHRLTSAG